MSIEARSNQRKATLPDIFGDGKPQRAATPTVEAPTVDQQVIRPHERQTTMINNIFRRILSDTTRPEKSTPQERQEELKTELTTQYEHTNGSAVHEVYPVLIDLLNEEQVASDLAKEDKATREGKVESGFLDPFRRVNNDIFLRANEDARLGATETPVRRLADATLRINALDLNLKQHAYRSPEDENDVMVANMRMHRLVTAYEQAGEPMPYAAVAETLEKIQANYHRENGK